jgi:hypothetical protein
VPPARPERNRTVRSFRQLRRFHHVINSDRVFGTHSLRQAVKLLKGEKLDPVITPPTMLITKDNASDILKKNGLL